MRKFDYSFLNNGLLPANLVNLTANISALKAMTGARKDEYIQIFTELEAVPGAMVKNGTIKRIGSPRATRYIKGWYKVNKMDAFLIRTEIMRLIELRQEGEYWDFKKRVA